jgi:hypothetical protein
MSDMLYEVTLKADWSREDTSSYDLTNYRRLCHLRREGQRSYQNLPACILWAEMTAHRATSPDRGLRTGTLKVVMRVEAGQYLTEASLRSRARKTLEWALMDITCRPPKLSNVRMVDNGVQWNRRLEVAA